MGACQAGASVSRADRTRPLHSAAVGGGGWVFSSPTTPSGRYRLVALPTPGDLLICAKDLFVDATAVWAATPRASTTAPTACAASSSASNRRSGSCATTAAPTTSASTASS